MLAHFGVRYDPQYNSLKLHGAGRLSINGLTPYFANAQFDGWQPRSGTEMELVEDHPDTLTVVFVYLKLENGR